MKENRPIEEFVSWETKIEKRKKFEKENGIQRIGIY